MTALMYHDVVPHGLEDTSGFPGRDAALYKVTPALFLEHLRAMAHVDGGRDVGDNSPTLTFDDGGASGVIAADILERFGLRGCFFVTANYVGANGFLDKRAIQELRQRGHKIGSHSC